MKSNPNMWLKSIAFDNIEQIFAKLIRVLELGMAFWLKNIRRIILILSFLSALLLYLYIKSTASSSELANIYLTQAYALIAVAFLYFSLLASPLYIVFPNFPLKPIYIKARQALGISAFIFALAHARIAFFNLLGGFPGLALLDDRYLMGITLSFTALILLTLLTLTSLRHFHTKLGVRWKKLHRLAYVAGVLILIHALMLGSHFTEISNSIPLVFAGALCFLLALEAIRLYKFIQPRIQK